jgi:hypothetical protein
VPELSYQVRLEPGGRGHKSPGNTAPERGALGREQASLLGVAGKVSSTVLGEAVEEVFVEVHVRPLSIEFECAFPPPM